MLLQTNSYVVPRNQRAEHARLLGRFRKALLRVGCDSFEVYEQTGADWQPAVTDGRFVQIIRFRDRQHQQEVRDAERMDLEAQSLIEEFCRLINFPYQQEHGLFAVGFYADSESEGELGSIGDSGAIQASESHARIEEAVKSRSEVDRDKESPPAQEELDELLNEQFGPSIPTSGTGSNDSELARVLDAGLVFDELDIPMEAELLDDSGQDLASPPESSEVGPMSHE